MSDPARKDDRLFVRKGRRSYRRSFSRTEVLWGAMVLVALAGLGAWVAWKGAHPDPKLFASGIEHLAVKAPASTDRTPFPSDLAATGWQEGPIAHYDSTNLYVKIDGREDYYKSFGFKALHWVSLSGGGDSAVTVDVELFDLGTAANALGAYAGERPPEATPHVDASGMSHRARNAFFMTAGRYYARLLGSDESPPVLAQLEHAQRALVAALPAEPLPWGYAIFVGGMGLDPGRVAYVLENAFSFGFAQRVYTARLDDADLEAFVVAAAGDREAADLAQRFANGFREYGEDGGTSGGVHWARDRYLGTFSTARAAGSWVVGVRGAPDLARGAAALAAVGKAVSGLPAETARRAASEAATSSPVTSDASSSAEPAAGPDGSGGAPAAEPGAPAEPAPTGGREPAPDR